MRDVVELMRAANPVPDPDGALSADELDALLLLTQTRSGTMDTRQLQTPVEPRKKKYGGWLVAAFESRGASASLAGDREDGPLWACPARI